MTEKLTPVTYHLSPIYAMCNLNHGSIDFSWSGHLACSNWADVQEYWIADRASQQVQVYRQAGALLKLADTLMAEDKITSPLLPGFSCAVVAFFR